MISLHLDDGGLEAVVYEAHDVYVAGVDVVDSGEVDSVHAVPPPMRARPSNAPSVPTILSIIVTS